MPDAYAFSDLLFDYLEDVGFTPGLVCRLSGVPRKTIQHWVNGDVKRPNTPNDLLAVAKALHLGVYQADCLLNAAGYPTLAELDRLTGDPQTRGLLGFWQGALAQEAPPPPFQVIAALPVLVGRDHEIQTLMQVLRGKDSVGVCCLSGMGGVGKTALAVHVAYRLRPYFPDGVLWARVDVTPALAILGAFAQAFDHDVSRTGDLYARSQVVRSILANKRVLIVLDNARQRAEIEPLLPPSGSCRVLITTRHHDLLLSSAGYRLVIEPFTEESGSAQALFAHVLGSERATREQEALTEIAHLVGHLPLALAISAGRLACELGWTAADFAACLRVERGRLSALEHDELSVRATLNVSYATLSALQRACLMAIGMCAGADVGLSALAAMMGLTTEATFAVVRALHGLSLVQPGATDRYRTHLLVKAYVLEQPIARALWQAMVRYFMTFLEQNQYGYARIDGEFDNLIGALAAALRCRLDVLYVRGVLMCSPYLRDRGHYDRMAGYLRQAAVLSQIAGRVEDRLKIYLEQGLLAEQCSDKFQAERIWRVGLEMARAYGDAAWVAAMLIPLGEIAGNTGRAAEMEAFWNEALAKIALLTDRLRASELLRQLGFRAAQVGDFRRAAAYWQDALALAREAGDSIQICRLLAHLSFILREQGRWDQAALYAQEGIDLARKHQFDWLAALMFSTLGIIAGQQRDFVNAELYLTEGVTLARVSGYRTILGDLLITRGAIARLCGDYAQSEHFLGEAQGLANQLSLACLTCEVYYERGEINLAIQQWEVSAASFTKAWEIAYEQKLHTYLAPISYGLARLAAFQHNYDEACRWGEESLQRYRTLGHYRTNEVARWVELLDSVRLCNIV